MTTPQHSGTTRGTPGFYADQSNSPVASNPRWVALCETGRDLIQNMLSLWPTNNRSPATFRGRRASQNNYMGVEMEFLADPASNAPIAKVAKPPATAPGLRYLPEEIAI